MIKLLIIDDELWTRNTIKTLGEWDKHGIQVVGEASDGLEGIKMIQELMPEIVITDMNMPGMNGVEVLQKLKEQYIHIKIIVVSGYNDFSYAKQAIKSSAVDYILKPVDAGELNNALDKCVKQIAELEYKQDISMYKLARSIDKKVISMVMEEKKVIQLLLSEDNISGIKNTLQRLYNNILKLRVEEASVGEFIFKVFIEIIREKLLLIEDDSQNNIDIHFISEQEHFKGGSLQDYFNLIQEMLGNAVLEISKDIKNKEIGTIAQVKRYIEKHYMEHISLESLSTKFFVSKEYLSKAFKAKFQKNIMNYIVELRMEKAKLMIEDKNISIKNISESVGYEDVSHFYKVFKNYFHISPGEMRKDN